MWAVSACGTVGSGVVRLLTEQREMLTRRLGRELVLAKVADLDLEPPRAGGVPRELLHHRAQDLLDDPEIDIVVELIGGLTAARDFMLAAIARGKHVVTANKALLAHHGNDILAAAAAQGRRDRLRSLGVRRHPHHPGPAPGPGRQSHPGALRHPERHLQLHPDPDVRARHELRPGPGRGPGGRALPRPTPPWTWKASTRPTSSPSS